MFYLSKFVIELVNGVVNIEIWHICMADTPGVGLQTPSLVNHYVPSLILCIRAHLDFGVILKS